MVGGTLEDAENCPCSRPECGIPRNTSGSFPAAQRSPPSRHLNQWQEKHLTGLQDKHDM